MSLFPASKDSLHQQQVRHQVSSIALLSRTEPDQFHCSDDPSTYHASASFVYSDAYTSSLRHLLDPQPNEQILDVGCGTGQLTAWIAQAVQPEGKVTGVDASRDMIAKAYGLAPSDAQLRYVVLDGHDLYPWLATEKSQGTYDKICSNAALHWMRRDPLSVAWGMRAALKRGGTLVLEMGGKGNVGAVHTLLRQEIQAQGTNPDVVDPWYFPSAEEYSELLKQAGFRVQYCALVVRPTPLPNGAQGWLHVRLCAFVLLPVGGVSPRC